MPTHILFTHRRTFGIWDQISSQPTKPHRRISSNENAISDVGRLSVPALADYLFPILFEPDLLNLVLVIHAMEIAFI